MRLFAEEMEGGKFGIDAIQYNYKYIDDSDIKKD